MGSTVQQHNGTNLQRLTAQAGIQQEKRFRYYKSEPDLNSIQSFLRDAVYGLAAVQNLVDHNTRLHVIFEKESKVRQATCDERYH